MYQFLPKQSLLKTHALGDWDFDRRGAKPTEVTLETPQVSVKLSHLPFFLLAKHGAFCATSKSSFDQHSLRMSQRNPNHQLIENGGFPAPTSYTFW